MAAMLDDIGHTVLESQFRARGAESFDEKVASQLVITDQAMRRARTELSKK